MKLAMEQCGQTGVKGVIIISAGFREIGAAGLLRQEKIQEIARKYGIPFIGPNCLGVINTDPSVHLNASFARRMPAAGSIGFLSQSGALCTAVLDYAHARNIGFSKFVSLKEFAAFARIGYGLGMTEDGRTADFAAVRGSALTNGVVQALVREQAAMAERSQRLKELLNRA